MKIDIDRKKLNLFWKSLILKSLISEELSAIPLGLSLMYLITFLNFLDDVPRIW